MKTDPHTANELCFNAEPDDVDSLIAGARALRDFLYEHTPAYARPDGYDVLLNAIIVRLQGE